MPYLAPEEKEIFTSFRVKVGRYSHSLCTRAMDRHEVRNRMIYAIDALLGFQPEVPEDWKEKKLK